MGRMLRAALPFSRSHLLPLSQSPSLPLFKAMPFDPAKPAPGDDLDAVLIRNQLNALKALIDAQAGQIASLQAQLTAVIGETSNNSNGVGNLNLNIANNPPQQSEVQPIADKVDELINALRR